MKLGVGMGAIASAGGLIVALLVSSCSSAGDLLGGLTGGIPGVDGGSEVAEALTQDDLQASLEGAGLLCANQQRLDDLLAERDTFRDRVLDCRAEAEERRTAIHRQVEAVVAVPADVTTIGGLVALLIADRARIRAERDAVLAVLNGIRQPMGLPDLTIEAAIALQEDTE